jgi:ubiquinone/menaquinone biosynthesis C-methylase UbiE
LKEPRHGSNDLQFSIHQFANYPLPMAMWFRKTSSRDSLAVTMTGVKLGDRLLAVGVNDVPLIATLATKVGLTGRACVVDADDVRVQRAAELIEREGALVETVRAPWDTLPYESDSFDVAVLRNVLMTMTADIRRGCLSEVSRVLRSGGRILVIEPIARGLFGSFMRTEAAHTEYIQHGGAKAALDAQGFAGVRVLAERGGTVYVEGAKRS